MQCTCHFPALAKQHKGVLGKAECGTNLGCQEGHLGDTRLGEGGRL